MTKLLRHLRFAKDMAAAVRLDTATIPGSKMGAVHMLSAETPSGPPRRR